MQLHSSLSILWHCLSLSLEWKLTFSSSVITAEFSKFAGILSAARSQHHLSNSSTGIPLPPLALFVVMFLRPTCLNIPARDILNIWVSWQTYSGLFFNSHTNDYYIHHLTYPTDWELLIKIFCGLNLFFLLLKIFDILDSVSSMRKLLKERLHLFIRKNILICVTLDYHATGIHCPGKE